MKENVEFTERETLTYEVEEIKKELSGRIDKRTIYRFWEMGEGDWKLQIIDKEDKRWLSAILIPKKVLDVILKNNVKEELKK
jgi:hypothetical protein